MGERETGVLRLSFDHRLKLDFHGSKLTSDARMLPYRELDDVVGLSEIAGDVLTDTRRGKNGRVSPSELTTDLFRRQAANDNPNRAVA